MMQICRIFYERLILKIFIIIYYQKQTSRNMKKSIITIYFTIFLIQITLSCNATHFDYVSSYTLGKQDQVNRTFTKIQKLLNTLKDVTYTNLSVYKISGINLTYFYIDSKQKMTLIGNDTIIIQGGILQIDITFNWSNANTITNGTGRVIALSDQVIFAKSLVVDQKTKKFYSYELLDQNRIQFSQSDSFKIARLQPPQASQNDKQAIKYMLNNIVSNGTTVRSQLQQQIQKVYKDNLKTSLHDQHINYQGAFNYTWVPSSKGKKNVTIQINRTALMVDVEKDGIYTWFEVFIEDFKQWKCGSRYPPLKPQNPKFYGGVQQFISYDFYQNVIRYAVQKDFLDLELNEQNWGNRMFSFNVGDLYEVIPALERKYFASQQITGLCDAVYPKANVTKGTNLTFNVSLHYDCTLYVSKARQKLIDFSIDIYLLIAGVPKATSMDFVIQQYSEPAIVFYSHEQYKILNHDLAEAILKDSLKLIKNSRVFGSGWPLSPPRDYPNFRTETNYTLVYDSTFIDSTT